MVIDLTGKGLNLTSLGASTTEFDYNGSGLEEHTAWVGAGTGLLVLPNAQGQVTNGTELFGPTSGNGFTDLSVLDSNHDGKITSADADWSQLEIWQDTNGNGVADPGELETLAQAGITSISLSYAATNTNLNGNSVVGTSTVTFSNNTTSTADEVDFAADLLDTQIDPNDTTAPNIPASIEALPWLKGYGQLYDLDVAMNGDATLVQDDTALTQVAAGNFAGFDAAVTALLYEWAGVTNVNPNSRGGYFDARSLETMEHYTGINWIHVGQGNVGSYHPYVTAAWDALFGNEELELAVQTAAFAVYLPGLTYSRTDDAVEGELDVQSAIASVPSGAPSGETGELFGLNGWLNFLGLVQANSNLLTDLLGDTNSLYAGAIVGLFGGYWIGSSSQSSFLQTDGSESFLYGNGWSGSIAAQSGAETIDTGNGNVSVSAPDGSKTIFTGSGSDTLNLAGDDNVVTLGSGKDTITLNGNNNTVTTSTGNDTITLSGTGTGNSFTTGTGPTLIAFNGGSGSVISGSANTSVEVGISDLFSMYDIPGSFAIASPASIVFTSNEYAGAITLSGDMQFSGNRYSGLYNLVFLPAGGTSPYTMGAPATGDIGTIVVDTAGNDALVFDDAGSVDTDYWVANDGTDTATLLAGKLDIEMAGPQSDYTVGYDGVSTLTLTDTGDVDGTGTKTITLTGGQGQIVFGDGSVIGLGNSQSISGEPVQYGTAGNDYFDVEGTELVEGGGGSNVADLEGSSHVPDNSWIIGENALGQATFTSPHTGYAGTATLAQIQTVMLDTGSYGLFTTPAGGGALTLGQSSGGGIVVDGPGTNTIAFNNQYDTWYWHAGAGTTTATLTQGTLYLYFQGPASDYTVAYDGKGKLIVTNRNGMDGTGTKTLILNGGGGELVFGDGIQMGIGNTVGTGEAVQYGSSGADNFTASGNGTIYGGSGSDSVTLQGTDYTMNGLWSVTENAAGQVVINGTKAGYDGTVTLSAVEMVNGDQLFATPAKGGALSLTSANVVSNTLVVDGAGTDTVTFNAGSTNYWHASAGTTTATLDSGTTDIYLAGLAADYTEVYDGKGQLVVTNTGNKDGTGTKTLILAGGGGDLVFGDGTVIGLGSPQTGSVQPVEYGSSGNDTFNLIGGVYTINGGSGTDTVNFDRYSEYDGPVPDAGWMISQNASGQTVISGTDDGTSNTATLTSVEQVEIGGTIYSLVVTPMGGGKLSVTAASVVLDTAGTDTINFTASVYGTNYWHAGAGTTTAALAGGMTEIYFAGAASDYTVTYNSFGTLTVTNIGGKDGVGTKTLIMSGGGGELIFGDGTHIGLGTSNKDDAVQYGTTGSDTFTVDGTATVYGGSGYDYVQLEGSTGVADLGWSISQPVNGEFVLNGAAAGWNGTVTLTGVEQVLIGGQYYSLFATPVGGGSLSVNSNGDNLITDGAGTDKLTLSSGTNDWHAGAGTTTATLSNSTTRIYFAGPASEYTFSYDGKGQLIVTNIGNKDGTGTKTLNLSTGANGELIFGDGTHIGFGNSVDDYNPDATQYGNTGSDTFFAVGGNGFIDGGSGSNTVFFNPSSSYNWSSLPDGTWTITENALGQVVMNGVHAGYDGTETLAYIQQVQLGSSTYNLLDTAVGGGGLTLNSSYGNAIVVDGAGTDTLTFDNQGTDYWHAGLGTTTATIKAGTTDIYFQGAASDYTITTVNATTIKVTDSVANRDGTKTIIEAGGTYNLVFGSDAAVPTSTTLNGTSGNDTFNISTGNYLINGNGGTDAVNFPYSDYRGLPSSGWRVTENASGQVVIAGTAPGYNGTVTLSQISQVDIDGVQYQLFATPVDGGAVSTTLANDDLYNSIVIDGAGTDTLSLNNGYITYWYAGAGTTAANFVSGTSDVFFTGPASDYTIAYDGAGKVVVTNINGKDGVGTKTITLTGGNGELVFGDGTRIGLGSTVSSNNPDSIQYGTKGNDQFYAAEAGGTINGGAGTNSAEFYQGTGDSGADGAWKFVETASGVFTLSSPADGYTGTVTLTHIQQVSIGGANENLFATPWGGGSLNLTAALVGYNATLVTDSAGTDTITFNDGTNYWHAGAGTTAATLTSGTTYLYLAGPASDYTETYDGHDKLVVTDVNNADGMGTKTLTLAGGNGDLVFGDGTVIGLGNTASAYSAPLQYGGNGNDTFTVSSGMSAINGGNGTNLVELGGSDENADLNWQVGRNATGQIVITGANAGYNGTALLTNVQEVGLGDETYDLFVTALNGGSLNLTSTAIGYNNTLVEDAAGTDRITFSDSSTNYWHAGAGTTSATLNSGITDIYFAGPASDYTESYNGLDRLVVTNKNGMDGVGTKTLTLLGGSGALIFGDGTEIGFGSQFSTQGLDPVEYGTNGNDYFTVVGGTDTIDGGSGTDTVDFADGTGTFDGRWSIVENTAGKLVVSGQKAGFNGTATLAHIEQLADGGGSPLTVVTTPVNGGSVTVTGSATLVVDGAGSDTLLFSGTGSNDWHAGAGTTTAVLSAGTTEIYFTGPAADYTESYDGTGTLTVTNTANKDGTGTKTIDLAGGTGELVFGDQTTIGLGGNSQTIDSVQYGGHTGNETLNGTSSADTIYTGTNNTVNGNGGNDTYLFGQGDGAVQINNGNGSGPAAGQVDILGSVTDQNLWFLQSGNNLVADILGTTDHVTIDNYFASGDTSAQVSQFDAGSLKLDTQLATLVQAMATYSADNGAFNPQTAPAMPTDATLQNAIAAAWHS